MTKIDSVHAFEGGFTKHTVICFLAKNQNRYLQVWVGSDVGETLTKVLNGEESDRPLTHNTMAQMLELLDAKVTSVEVNGLKETTYFGVINLESNGASKQLDARPSDAVTLALLAKAPIYVADEVLEQAGKDLPSPFNEEEWLDELKAKHQEHSRWAAKWEKALTTEISSFTKRARQVCIQMATEAATYNHNYIGTEHLLLGLMAVNQSLSAKVLAELGIAYTNLQELMERLVGHRENPPEGDPTIVPRVAHVFELAEVERAKMGHTYLGTEHLLLGLIAESESESSDKKGMAMQFLDELGVDTNAVREKGMAVFTKVG